MKRSEMLKILRDSVLYHTTESPNAKTNTGPQITDAVLKDLEEAGMLPPPIDSEFWNRSENDFHKVNEWEPEDE